MGIDSIFNGLHINTYYKYILVLSGVTLIITFIINFQGNQSLRIPLAIFVGGGLFCWFLDSYLNMWSQSEHDKTESESEFKMFPEERRALEHKYYQKVNEVIRKAYLIQGIVWIVIVIVCLFLYMV